MSIKTQEFYFQYLFLGLLLLTFSSFPFVLPFPSVEEPSIWKPVALILLGIAYMTPPPIFLENEKWFCYSVYEILLVLSLVGLTIGVDLISDPLIIAFISTIFLHLTIMLILNNVLLYVIQDITDHPGNLIFKFLRFYFQSGIYKNRSLTLYKAKNTFHLLIKEDSQVVDSVSWTDILLEYQKKEPFSPKLLTHSDPDVRKYYKTRAIKK